MKNKPIYKLLGALGLFAYCQFSFSKDLILFETATDELKTSAPNTFQLQRTYQSRSLHRGLLGYSWCLPFDKSLAFQPGGEIWYTSCEFDQPVRFTKLITTNHKTIYKSISSSNFSLQLSSKGYTLKTSQNETWYYNRKGQLIKWRDPGSNQMVHIVRNSQGHLRWLLLVGGEKIRVITNSSGTRIFRLISKQQKIIYKYSKDHELISVKTSSEAWTYSYDEAFNLREIHKNSLLIQRMTYDLKKDRIQSLEINQFSISFNNHGQIKSILHPRWGQAQFIYKKENGKFREIRTNNGEDLNPEGLLQFLNVASRSQRSLFKL